MAFVIFFVGLVVSARAFNVLWSKPSLDGTSSPQEERAKSAMDEATSVVSMGRQVADHPLSFLTVRSSRPSSEYPMGRLSHRIEDPLDTAWTELANKEAADTQDRFRNLVMKIDRKAAVAIGAISGSVIGALAGGSGLWHGPGAVRCGVVGGFVGGVLGVLWELPSEGGRSVVDALTTEAPSEAKPKPQGNITELPEPALEKLHQLALTAVALSDYEESRAQSKGNETEERIERAAEKKAVRALGDIAERINSTKREPMVQSEGDFEDVQEVLSEGDTAELVTAETAAANNALVTANDVARVQAGKNGSRLRAEDMGPVGDMKSFQGDMIPGSPEQLALFQTMAENYKGKPSLAAGTPWTGATVKYCFASDVPAQVKHIFQAAANQYHVAVPCLKFVDVGWASGSSTSHESQQRCKQSPAIFVQSNPAEGCYAYVGMVPWLPSQRLQLQDPGCLSIGTAVHELGHSLGMAHEQSRPDRDKHVLVHWNNIQRGKEHNFEVEPNAYTDGAYDMLSIMHYDSFAFAVDPNKPSIECLGGHQEKPGAARAMRWPAWVVSISQTTLAMTRATSTSATAWLPSIVVPAVVVFRCSAMRTKPVPRQTPCPTWMPMNALKMRPICLQAKGTHAFTPTSATSMWSLHALASIVRIKFAQRTMRLLCATTSIRHRYALQRSSVECLRCRAFATYCAHEVT